MTTYNRVLAALKARPSPSRPNTWTARCPAHDDRSPSLRIWLGRKGNLLVRCWTLKCDLRPILEAVGLTMSDLFPPDAEGPYGRHQAAPAQPRRIVAAYDYTDALGTLVSQTVRFEPKAFSQRRPDSDHPGQWIWNLDGVPRVLFRLPRLLERPRSTALIVEGEKDVLALEALGLLAVCNRGGTGMGWHDDYSWQLRGRRVVILPDNDASGWAHADRVAGSLLRCQVGSVRIVGLPGLPEGGDVSNWLEMGHGREDLIGVIRKASEYSRCG